MRGVINTEPNAARKKQKEKQVRTHREELRLPNKTKMPKVTGDSTAPSKCGHKLSDWTYSILGPIAAPLLLHLLFHVFFHPFFLPIPLTRIV